MNENLPTNIQMNANDNGSVIFATDVVSTIAGLAATEVEGVTNMVGASSGLADLFSRKNQSSKSLTKGVKVELSDDNKVTVSLTIVVDYGSPIPEVAGNIQENVKKAIETMSGLTVTAVNVHVSAVSFEKEQRAAAEIEEKQRLMLQQKAAEPEPAPAPAEAAPAPAAQAKDADDDEYVLDLGDDDEPAPEADAANSDTAAEEAAAEAASEETAGAADGEDGKGEDATAADEPGATV